MSRKTSGGSSSDHHVFSEDSDADSASRSAWDRLNVLTFDGGGVKGYYSLLQLQKLMEFIKEAEEKLDQEEGVKGLQSSFSPCKEPANVSHITGPYTHYLPCHYFDYIAGTSTGALITIMLARLRMPVEDCLAEYRQFGGIIFGNPRLFHQVGKRAALPFCKKNKFKTSDLEEAIKDVIRRRGEVSNDHDDAMPFTTPKGLCRAIVLVNIEERLKADNFFLFRSYDHFSHRRGAETPSAARDTEEGPKNPGRGTRFAAWKVARAATAAKLYFKPLVVVKDDGDIVRGGRRRTATRRTGTLGEPRVVTRTSSGLQMPTLPRSALRAPEEIYLTDAGLGRINNPSEQVLLEVRYLIANRNKKIDTWVSIGTARERTQPKGKKPHASTLGVVTETTKRHGDTEPSHEYMNRESQSEGRRFQYFRLNQPDGLSMDMDEWKVRGEENLTLKTIRAAFNEWAIKLPNVKMFRLCADELVRNRRQRVKNAARWERYALGNFYVCGEKNCSYDCDETWNYRDEFERHLQEHHKMKNTSLEDTLERYEQHWDYKAAPPSAPER